MEEEGKRKRDEENIQRGEEKRKREEGYTAWKDCVEELQDRVAVTEKNKALREKAKAVQDKNIALDEKTKAVQEKTKLEEEMEKMRKFVAELQGAVECPVCLMVPREGPVPCCPAGHFTCSPCLERWRGEGKEECPTCRVPMGEGKSLLAKMVIENMEHECSFEGCEAMVAHEDYKGHQEACSYRPVICPGNSNCAKMVPFCEVEEHVKTCKGCLSPVNTNTESLIQMYTLSETILQDPSPITWGTMAGKSEAGKDFFFRMRRVNQIFSMEVVMLGNEEECEKAEVEIRIMNPETNKVFFKSMFNPRPITTTNSEEICLTVTQATLSKFWQHRQTTKDYRFKVSVRLS